ncbi:MAG: PfkB family carbohydrate kinase [Erysipelotrichaceae bacterium]
MTERERQILQWIKENPMITQQEIAERAHITRSSAGVHISNLVKKGMIQGRGYVLREKPYICVIGALNVDITGSSSNKLIAMDSNPGKVQYSFGGVGRNIAENLARMDCEVELISVIGDDVYASELQAHASKVGISLQHALRAKGANTSTYLCINDAQGEMQLAISDMDLYKQLTPTFLESKLQFINQAALVVLDLNLSQEAIDYLAQHVQVPLFVDPVSTSKAMKIKPHLQKVNLIKPNLLEAQALVGKEATPQELANGLLEMGVKNVLLSMGEQGVYYANTNDMGLVPSIVEHIVNTTGCGDAFMAGVVYGYLKNESLHEMAKYGSAASAICIASPQAVSTQMQAQLLEERKEETL